MADTIAFYLPFGLSVDGKLYRHGSMRLATTKDELDIQATDEVGMNTRYRDLMLLARVIEELDGIKPVNTEMIENLYEADFLYLQLLYRELNGEAAGQVTAVCPECGSQHAVSLANVYEDMSVFRKADDQAEAPL